MPEAGDYLTSEFHTERVETAASLVLERLTAIAKAGPEAAISEIMGISVGIARFQQRIPSRQQRMSARLLGDPLPGRRKVATDDTPPEPQDEVTVAASAIRLRSGPLTVLRLLMDGEPHLKADLVRGFGGKLKNSNTIQVYLSEARTSLRAAGIELDGSSRGVFQLSAKTISALRQIPGLEAAP